MAAATIRVLNCIRPAHRSLPRPDERLEASGAQKRRADSAFGIAASTQKDAIPSEHSSVKYARKMYSPSILQGGTPIMQPSGGVRIQLIIQHCKYERSPGGLQQIGAKLFETTRPAYIDTNYQALKGTVATTFEASCEEARKVYDSNHGAFHRDHGRVGQEAGCVILELYIRLSGVQDRRVTKENWREVLEMLHIANAALRSAVGHAPAAVLIARFACAATVIRR